MRKCNECGDSIQISDNHICISDIEKTIMSVIADKTKDLDDIDYIEVLKGIKDEINTLIRAKKEEINF